MQVEPMAELKQQLAAAQQIAADARKAEKDALTSCEVEAERRRK